MAFLCALMAAQAVADLKEQNTKIFLILERQRASLLAALSASNGKAMRYAIAALAVTVLTFCTLERFWSESREKDWQDVWCLRCVCRCLLQLHHLLYTGRIFLCRTFYKKRRVGVRVTGTDAVKMYRMQSLRKKDFTVWNCRLLFNRSLASSLNTTEFYYSVIPKSMKDLYVSLGMAEYERPNVFHGLENRQILKNMPCGGKISQIKKKVTCNEDALPVGYIRMIKS